ncbi:MAG TPA: enoyl-CoA hydratase/isomerase family protein [Ilumatobacter sp.]|nr:enoyl-CoA hydratase/isomerase family protein [Ilumatobacter sp.]
MSHSARVVSIARRGALATVLIDHAAKRNALSGSVQDGLISAFEEIARDDNVAVVVLTSAGDSFCSGGDLAEIQSHRTVEAAEAMARRSRSVLDRIRRCPAPVVAGLNGDAIGGGTELALACDFRVVAHGASMLFAQGRQALSPAWGGGVDLIERVGPSMAQRLLGTTARVSGDEGLRLGLFDAVAAADETIDDAVAAFVEPLLRRPTQVLRANKALAIASRMNARRDELEAIELEQFTRTWMHADHWEALDGFLNRQR